jgi:hypothetical protein
MTSIWKTFGSAALCMLLAASALAQGPGPGGKGYGGMQMGPNNTSGWGLMSKQERAEHQDKMRSMQNHGECTAYMEQHHAMMADRAKEKGRPMPGKPKRDACAGMKK